MTDLNDLSYWYPLIEGLVPTPETRIVKTEVDLLAFLDKGDDEGFGPMWDFIDELAEAGEEVGWPCFLRTGHGSDKHSWKRSCFVSDVKKLPSHVMALVEWSEMADFLGMPYRNWVVRELLPTEAAFHAFWGDMPITKERRYFAQDGTVLGFHPYWPPEALEGNTEATEWRAKLDVLNEMPDSEVMELSVLSAKVSRALPGAWSIDWLWTTDRGWVLTDMAVASQSFCWSEHPNAPKGDLGPNVRQAALDGLFQQP